MLSVFTASVLIAVLDDFNQRHLSDLEKERVGKVVEVAIRKFESNAQNDAIKKNLADGYDEDTAKETVEAILAAAQREHQSRKIKYIGYLLGNLNFHPEVTPIFANQLIRSAESLTYNQLILLQIFSDEGLKAKLLQKDYSGKSGIPWDIMPYLHETKELYNNGLLGMPGDSMIGLSHVNPGKMITQGQGKKLKELMDLDEIPQAEIQEAASKLSKEIS